MACADIRKLWKLFDKETAIGELWYLVPVFQKKFSGMFIYNILDLSDVKIFTTMKWLMVLFEVLL